MERKIHLCQNNIVSTKSLVCKTSFSVLKEELILGGGLKCRVENLSQHLGGGTFNMFFLASYNTFFRKLLLTPSKSLSSSTSFQNTKKELIMGR